MVMPYCASKIKIAAVTRKRHCGHTNGLGKATAIDAKTGKIRIYIDHLTILYHADLLTMETA
jgi:hypothetical protein